MSATPSSASPRAQWDAAATGWDAHGPQIGAWLSRATEAMIGMAGIGPGSRVLDVAAGSGQQTLAIAQRVGPTGRVLATDLSPRILALASENARRAGHAQVQTHLADAEDLGLEAGTFDAAVCRLGLMLFNDPSRGLREMHRALRPGGRVCAMVFSRPERNPCVTVLLSTALRHAGLPPTDPCRPGGLLSLGQPGRTNELFAAAGFEDVATTQIDAPFKLPSARAYLDFVRDSGSPVRHILDGLDEAAATAAWADMEVQLSVFTTTSGWEGPNELLLTAGRR